MGSLRKDFDTLGHTCSVLALSLLLPSTLGQPAAAPSGEITAAPDLGQNCNSDINVLPDGDDGWPPLGDAVNVIVDSLDAGTYADYVKGIITGFSTNETLMGLYKNVLMYNRDSGNTCFQVYNGTSTTVRNWVYTLNLGTGIFVFGDTYHFNILVFDHGAVNHCGADGGWAHWGFTGAFTRYEFTDSSSNNLAPVDYNDDDGWLPSLEFLANLIASVSSAGPRSLGSVTVVSFATSLLIAHCRCYVVFD